MSGYVSVASFSHAGRYTTGLDDTVVAVRGAVFLAAGQFSDGGHGRTVGLSEQSIVPCSEEIKKIVLMIQCI